MAKTGANTSNVLNKPPKQSTKWIRFRTCIVVCLCLTVMFALLLNGESPWADTNIATTLFAPPEPPAPRNNIHSLYRDGTRMSPLGQQDSGAVMTTVNDFNYSITGAPNSTLMSVETTQTTNELYNNASTITSANASTVDLLNEPVKGQLLHLMIQARDVHGRPKTSGGDVWFVIASSVKESFYTSARVFDHSNGSYSAYVFVGWNYSATIRVKLAYSSHAAHFIEEKYWTSATPRVYWSAHFKQGNVTESATCHITTEGWNDVISCAYPRPIAMGENIAFVCDKPPSLPCEALNDYLVNGGKTNRAVRNFGAGNMWLFNGSMEYHIGVNVTLKTDTDAVNNSLALLDPCFPDEPNPLSHGYWVASKWMSLVCKTRQWSRPDDGNCLREKKVLLLGDSSTRQWYYELVKLLGENNSLKGVEMVVKTKVIPEFNFTVYWHFHPWTIGSVRRYIANLKYEVDILDELNTSDCSKYVIVVSPWAHFTQWRRSAYVERLRLLKLAVQRLQTRCPGVPVVVRGPHPRSDAVGTPTTLFSAADYMLYKMNTLMRDMFFGIGVHYIDIWDLNLSHPSKNTIHMPAGVVRQEVFMFLSYVCNNSS